MNWTKSIVFAWGLLLSYSTVLSNLPTSWWYEPGTLRVEDAPLGTCPRISFDREINRPFYAEWVVTIMKKTSQGGWATFLTYPGQNDYLPSNVMPDDPDLCWWAWVNQLDLPPGEYKVHTLWNINPKTNRHREVRRSSNSFHVLPTRRGVN